MRERERKKTSGWVAGSCELVAAPGTDAAAAAFIVL